MAGWRGMAGRTPTEPEGVVVCQLWLPRTTLVFSSHRLGVSVFSLSPTSAYSTQSTLTLTRLIPQSFIAH